MKSEGLLYLLQLLLQTLKMIVLWSIKNRTRTELMLLSYSPRVIVHFLPSTSQLSSFIVSSHLLPLESFSIWLRSKYPLETEKRCMSPEFSTEAVYSAARNSLSGRFWELQPLDVSPQILKSDPKTLDLKTTSEGQDWARHLLHKELKSAQTQATTKWGTWFGVGGGGRGRARHLRLVFISWRVEHVVR